MACHMFSIFKPRHLLCLALLMGHGLAFAQTSQFEGFSLRAGFGSISQNIFKANMVYLANPNVPVSSPSADLNATVLILGASYTKALDDRFTLGLEFNMSAHDSKAIHSINYLGPTSFGVNMWNTNQFTLSLAPGYLLTPDTLLYSKIGTLRITTMCANDIGSACASNHLPGINFGLGVRQMIKDSNTYFYIESNKNQLFSASLTTLSNPVSYTLNASSINFIFGLGRHFH